MIQRGGQVVLHMLPNVQQKTIKPIIEEEFALRKVLDDSNILSAQQKRDEDAVVSRAAFEKMKAHFTPEQLAIVDGGQKKPTTSAAHSPATTLPSTSTHTTTTAAK